MSQSRPSAAMMHDFAGGVSERIEVSSGTMPPSGLEPSAQRYKGWARVPRGPWRKLSEEEAHGLVAKEADSGRATVQLIRAPMELVRRFRTAVGDTACYATADDFQAAFNTEQFRSCLDELGQWACLFGEEEETKERLVRVNRPGLHTVTRDPVEGTYIGMHVDNTYCHPLKDRSESPRRMCLNIGTEARYLLFVDLPLQDMDSALREAGIPDPRSDMWMERHVSSPMGLAFMEVFPEYPVLRLRVEPGEGYIATTENMLHDASTLGMRSWDLLASVFGRFATCRLAGTGAARRSQG